MERAKLLKLLGVGALPLTREEAVDQGTGHQDHHAVDESKQERVEVDQGEEDHARAEGGEDHAEDSHALSYPSPLGGRNGRGEWSKNFRNEVKLMRTLPIFALSLLTVPAFAQGNPNDPDKKVAGGGSVPAGWSYRLESATASIADAKFVTMGSGLHFSTGPAGIYWRDADATTGAFHTVANFVQTKAPAHPEAYGLFVAGQDLKGPGASYTYLIVRGNGMYSIWNGGAAGTRSTAVVPWTANAAVTAQDSSGKATNKLEIASDGKKLTFKVNGTTVHEMDAPSGGGLVGIRMNHNLDVHVDGFAVHKM